MDMKVIELLEEFLSDRERQVIEMRFGLTCEPQTLKSVGEYFGVTGVRIRQIQAKAIRRLRHPSRIDRVVEVLSDNLETSFLRN